MSINCLIIDDEPIAQEIIERYLAPFDQIQIVGKCINAVEANSLLQSKAIDLIFLDIQMPHIDGLAFIKSLANPPKVIVTTAHREYAIDAFEIDVVDYLLKPISQERFLIALNRVLLVDKITKESAPYIYLKVNSKMVQVYLSEICYIQGLSNYVKVYCDKRTLICYQKLSHLEGVLPDPQFKRAHKSYIVNLKKVRSYTSRDLDVGIQEIPIGANYREGVISHLAKYKA
ncbi:hypothetical protein BFP97_16010 [Roseivirga sp. 4D4]|uniref:LytR/AlgR family response regulator transcription factor n=1 Tax=Roseivirga sp. 4D4 TaxID=1889784 RepID=UPI0008530067|nr:LytTR family DNA-binding domain-containing protein [Roseivirga sp. 4D4]OEK02936.1 hypothetical protein BFP97_16010 [Roseivirga sp. 4D4]